MPAKDPRKRAVFLAVLSVVVILLLVLVPIIASILQAYAASHLGLAVTPSGSVTGPDGAAPDPVIETSIALIVNVFQLAKVILWMVLVISVVRLISLVIFSTALRSAGQNEITSLVRTVLSVLIYIVAFFIIFQSQYPSIQLAPLFTGSTIIGIVVALALQDTLGNLFAGIALQADQPFEIGDVVTIGSRGTGIVESVTWRGVKIRTFQNRLIVMSNAVLGRESIEVTPKNNLNARIVFFSTLYSQTPAKVAKLVRDAVSQVDNVSPAIRPVVRIKLLGESGVDWEVKYWADDYTRFNDTDAAIRQRIWYLFNREDIGFPFPTRTVYMEKEPEAVTREEFLGSVIEELRRLPIFSPLTDDQMRTLAAASTVKVYAPGESIVKSGQQGNSMFAIVRGAVDVKVPHGDGMRSITRLGPSDFFGEMSLLTGEPRTATVIAEDETEVIRIDKSALKPLFEEDPDLMQAIVEIVEGRRQGLHQEEAIASVPREQAQSVLASIRKFFNFD